MGFSPRYTPVTGRLHTRYAPVRRSSAEYCYSLLPLDLHVLSLPLAFILSQDQTLHCKNCSFTFIDSSPYPPPYLYMVGDTRYLFLLIRFKLLCPPLAENGCKSTTFFQITKIFFQKNQRGFIYRLENSLLQRKKIFHPASGTASGLPGTPSRIPQTRPFLAIMTHKFAQNQLNIM